MSNAAGAGVADWRAVLRWWHWLLAGFGAVIGVATAARLALGVPAVMAFGVVAGAAAVLAAIDIATHLLPHRIVLPTLGLATLLLALEALLGAGPGSFARALAAALVATAILFVLAFINPAGLGLGDVVLAAPLGLVLGWLGWTALAIGLLAAFVLNGLLIVALLVTGRTGRGREVPFGPSMVLGAAVAVAAHIVL